MKNYEVRSRKLFTEGFYLWLVFSLFYMLFAFGDSLKPENASVFNGYTKLKICSETEEYYHKKGIYKKTKELLPFLDSAIRVSKMYKGFPELTERDSAIKYFCWGAIESQFERNFVYVNIPGTNCPGIDKSVKRFSLDFGWAGINSLNTKWVYEIAESLRDNRPPSKNVLSGLHPKTFPFLKKNFRIPNSLPLKRINGTKLKKKYQNDYAWFVKTKRKGKYRPHIPYTEETDSDLDSILIYRAIIETDRMFRGWEWRTWDKPLHQKLAIIK